MRCDRYETCITKPDENATVSITYFWSDKAWNVTSNGAQVPVAIEIYATGKFGHIFQREVMQRYDFYDFYRDVRPDPDELVPPVDVYCRGRKDIYAPPARPSTSPTTPSPSRALTCPSPPATTRPRPCTSPPSCPTPNTTTGMPRWSEQSTFHGSFLDKKTGTNTPRSSSKTSSKD
nr:platelet glycoprotein Ib alpha chain-like [Penaeus vannamei]